MSHSGTERVNVAYLEILGDFTNKALEGELADKQLGRLLVTPNFTKSDGTGAEPVRLLDTSSGGLEWQKKERKMNFNDVDNVGNPDDSERRTWAVFLAALVASCLRGALPEGEEEEKIQI